MSRYVRAAHAHTGQHALKMVAFLTSSELRCYVKIVNGGVG